MTAITGPAPRIRVPDLGPRGEGWVAIQAGLFVAVIATGFAGPLWAGPTRVIGALAGLALMAGGIALIVGGVVGLRRQLTAFPRPVADGELIAEGVFGLVRHPMYGGGILCAVGWGLLTASVPTLLCALALALFFDLKPAARRPGSTRRSRRTPSTAVGRLA